MAQGIFVNGKRPKSKKEVKEAVKAGIGVGLQATSITGDEYEGLVTAMPEGKVHYFVGPDPHDRKFYGQIERHGDKVVVR